MTKIAIDARFYGTENTGLGRYTTNVLTYLPQYLKKYELNILLRKKYYETLQFPSNCKKVLADVTHYSLAEQMQLPSLINSLNCDLLYALHFNVPLNLSIPFIVTIHDLIKTHFTGSDTTTHGSWLFCLKRLGYDYTMRHAINKSTNIIVPSNTVKNDILSTFNEDPTKIQVVPEAPDDIFRDSKIKNVSLKLPSKYLLFVGNAYPHKNLAVLLKAISKLPDYDLVIVTKPSPFLSKLLNNEHTSKVHVLSDLTDQELFTVYQKAAALVTPSLMEGYGLPGIEALMVGTPVIASDIAVYHEVYGDKVTYFDPNSVTEFIKSIRAIGKHPAHPLRFNRTWNDVARDIAEVIDESCSRL